MSIWEQLLVIVRQELGSRLVDTWLKALVLYQWDAMNKVVYLEAPNSFVRDWVSSNYVHILKNILIRLLQVNDLQIIIFESAMPPASAIHAAPKMSATTQLVRSEEPLIVPARLIKTRAHLNKNYQFDTLIKGPHNQMACAAALAIAQKPGALYNPLFIYGDSGVGKTHLLHAIANQVQAHHARLEVLYQPAERFVSEFIHAVRFDKINKFQAKYKNIDVFLVDDVQCIAHKEQTQEAFFHIFNTLYDAHKQIVFSGDVYPAHMRGMTERLRSRMTWGLAIDMQMPSLETRVAIVKQKAIIHQKELSDEVAYYIAQQGHATIRELEGSLIRVLAYASLNRQDITIDLVRKTLMHLAPSVETTHKIYAIGLEKVLAVVSQQFDCPIADLRSKTKSREVAHIRQVAMYLMKKLTQRSLHEIAYCLRRKDHTTVIHGVKQVEARMEKNEHLAKQIRLLEQQVCV